MKKLLIKGLLLFVGLSITVAILLCFYWGIFRSSNWGKYYFQKMTWKEIFSNPASHKEPLIVFVIILLISIILVIIDEMRLSRKSRNKIEPVQSFIRTYSPNEYNLCAILFGLMSVLGILFIIIPFLYEGDFSLNNIKAHAIYFINITLVILGTILCLKRSKNQNLKK